MHTQKMGRQRKAEDVQRGNRLKFAREQAGYETAADASDEMDIHYPTYQAHESGWRAFDRKTARKYAEFYLVNVDWLDEEVGAMKGGKHAPADLLAGLSPEDRETVISLINRLKSKS